MTSRSAAAVSLTGPGDLPFVFTAPHDKRHERNQHGVLRMKMSEPGTGVLAHALALRMGGTAVVSESSTGDANWDEEHPLKDAIIARGLISAGTTLVDLHGMRDTHGFDIALGPGLHAEHSPDLVADLDRTLRAAGFAVEVFWSGLFAARGEHRLTTWAQRLGARAVQVEISARIRRELILDSQDHPLTHSIAQTFS